MGLSYRRTIYKLLDHGDCFRAGLCQSLSQGYPFRDIFWFALLHPFPLAGYAVLPLDSFGTFPCKLGVVRQMTSPPGILLTGVATIEAATPLAEALLAGLIGALD
jgi:hypothetical protein